MKETVLRFNRPNKNGRIYSQESFKFAETGYVLADAPREAGGISVDAIIGTYRDMRIEEDRLVCDITMLDGLVSPLMEDTEASFVTSGIGEVSATGEITNYELTCIFATTSPA